MTTRSARHPQQPLQHLGLQAQARGAVGVHHIAMVQHHGVIRNRQYRLRMLLDDDRSQSFVARDAADGAQQLFHDDRRQSFERLVEQHPQAVLAISDHAVVLDQGNVVHADSAANLRLQPEVLERLLGVAR